jgi:hypothetical protein
MKILLSPSSYTETAFSHTFIIKLIENLHYTVKLPKTGHTSLTELEKKKVEGIRIKKMKEDEGVGLKLEQYLKTHYIMYKFKFSPRLWSYIDQH